MKVNCKGEGSGWTRKETRSEKKRSLARLRSRWGGDCVRGRGEDEEEETRTTPPPARFRRGSHVFYFDSKEFRFKHGASINLDN
ncbi:hypothetical protein QVD17_26631 [Tagetes erecta]|uniref:Uncharacterized protein n=1 Tax=Tagetes erecta TaxID=13708 RepID=A0AAD8K794_TARER|nr:hypothetical protein QVD17_26631 [Tagetes erecta]